MKRSTLASRLIETRRISQRKQLLSSNRALADENLARELKDECYRVWTSDPTKAQSAASALDSLAEFAPTNETHAMRAWVNGIADITRGKLEDAIANLDTASGLLKRCGLEHDSAQPQVAKLIALAMLGRYDSARRTGEKSLKIFSKYNDQLAAGKIELNLSNIVSRRDQYRLAEQYCMSAYRRFRKLGETSWQTMAENGLANTYAELNDFKRAEKFYASALANARRARMNVTVAEIEASMGNLALFRGRYADAIRLLELSREKYEKLGMPHQTAIAELEIADIYAELNMSGDALELYGRLVPTLQRLKLRAEEARARNSFGRVLADVGNLTRAKREYTRASILFAAEKNPVAAAAVKIRLASLELQRDNFAAALENLADASASLETSGNIRLQLAASWVDAEALRGLGRVDEAEQLFKSLLLKSRRSEQTAVEQATLNSLGLLASTAGRTRDAERYFEASIAAAESARAPLPAEEFRMAFFAKTLEPYTNLTRLFISQGDLERAFNSVERARSRGLVESLGSSGRTATTPAIAKLREELNWYYTRLSRAEGDDVERLGKEIRRREKRLSAETLRAESLGRRRATSEFRAIDLADLKQRLGSGKALVEFIKLDGVFSAFVVTDKGIEYVDAIADETDMIRSQLAGLQFQFGTFRFAGDALDAFAEQLKDRANAYLEQLYRKLFDPIAHIVGERDLIIVAAGAINYVPFNALFDGTRYLIESRQIVNAPSATVWLSLNAGRTKKPKNSLLMAYADERIPLANDEVKNLEGSVPKPVTLSGRRATFSAFQKNAPGADIIHLVCHGQFRPDNAMFSSLHLADGWVTVRDVTATRLRAQLVTLSACETGLNEVYAGEELLGLARGFLSAGARSLLLSLWTVSDAATVRLMSDFYQNLQRGETIAASLRLAQLEFIKNGEHPYFWSPFFVIG